MKKKIKDMSFLNKLTVGYIVFVLIPVVCISFYSYNQVQQFYRFQNINESQKYVNHIKNSVVRKIEIIENISENVVYNTVILDFLKNSFIHSSYEIYSEKIYPAVNYAICNNKVNICNIRIFMNNTTIPEGWAYFFDDKRLYDQDWYKQFIASDNRELWVRLNGKNYFKNKSLGNALDKDMFIYFRKIIDYDGLFLGTVAIEIFDEDLFLERELEIQRDLFFLHSQEILYTSENIRNSFPVQIVNNHYFNVDETYFEYDQNLFVYDKIDDLNVTFGVVTSLSDEKKVFSSLKINTISIICATIILIVIFYLFIKNFFNTIKKYMEIMNKVVQGDFSLRIPVKGRNEIGIIGENFNLMIKKINELIKDIVKKEMAQKQAQMNALQYQINPHFFYNTLDIFAGKMVLTGNYDLADAIADFGKMLRYNLSNKCKYSTIQAEIGYIKNYIRIQKIKCGENLRLFVNLPEFLLNFQVLKFILQPIVENSIIHGFHGKNSILEITINFVIEGKDIIKIEIMDNGTGISEKDLKNMNLSFEKSNYMEGIKEGIGLRNINERLKLFYGDEYFIRMESVEGEYTKVILFIPFIKE